MASSKNLVFCWERGHYARIFQQDAGETPAYPGVFGGCLYVDRRSAGHGSAGVLACGMQRKTQYLLKSTMREERYVRLCENMKHGMR